MWLFLFQCITILTQCCTQIKTRKLPKNTNEPEWNERICFPGTFPSLCQTFIVQLMCVEKCSTRCYGDFEINFSDMGNMIDGDFSNLFGCALKENYFYGFVYITDQFPSIGPTYIHFYETSRKTNYLGRLLLSISSDVDIRATKSMHYDVQAILPLLEVKMNIFFIGFF